MTSNVEVVQVETVKAGKTDRIVLHYKADRTKGETWKVGGLAVKLDESSRNTLKNAKPGDIISAKIAKEGNFYNLVSASAAETVGSTRNAVGTSNVSTKTVNTDTRIQMMNALTNAVTSLGVGASVDDIETRTIELILVGNRILESCASNTLVSSNLDMSSFSQIEDNDDDSNSASW